ncbi:MAG TPA: pyruvate, phosphate dikinase, partial [Actinomycetota bacterium]|nr:pyruvate, phosphate dikinase [Actinomycetota bacterium]
MTKYVYDFHEGNREMKDLLGGKGANLAEMTNMGLPVPHGFTLTTEACLAFLEHGDWPEGLIDEAEEHLVRLEHTMGKTLGDPTDPLLVSIRSGARFSMPGMMDTVLNLGLNDDSLKGLAHQTGGDTRFASDTYRRFIQMFGKIVMNIPAGAFEHALDEAKAAKGPKAQDTDLDADDLRALIDRFLSIYEEHTGSAFPTDPRAQMRLATEAVFRSWNGKRAIDYRRQNKIADDLGTAVNVVAMVFGNRGEDSGTGVAFTRDPSTGEKVPYGDYLANAQGEDVVAGIRNTEPLSELQKLDPVSYGELLQVMHTLEMHYRDMCDIEFTIEKGRLWILQTRIGKRTALAEWVMAYDMLEEGLIHEDEALLRIDADRLEELFKRRVRPDGATPIANGLNASPGAATGEVVFTADEAQARARGGAKVILVRRETTPDDYHGMIAAQGILTSAGGTNSHAAVVARGEGIPAVCGADAIKLDQGAKTFEADGTTVAEGDVVTIDGFTGAVYVGELALEESVLEKARAGDAAAREEKIWHAFERLMAHADARRRMRVRANADTPDQSTNSRERGAEGIGLCRTEHMFLGPERVAAVQQMIFAETAEEEQAAYDVLLPLQRSDFVGIFRAMSGLPVTVRLLDPPLHEFLPNQVELAV